MDCPICLEGLGDSAISLPCGHLYCSPCVARSTQEGRIACPTCRRTFLNNPNPVHPCIRRVFLDRAHPRATL
ncbi:hypothetical protein BKA70DRAFT_1315735, partial [Coprinopsis sp. MPI-PUGE-AT-0042]